MMVNFSRNMISSSIKREMKKASNLNNLSVVKGSIITPMKIMPAASSPNLAEIELSMTSLKNALDSTRWADSIGKSTSIMCGAMISELALPSFMEKAEEFDESENKQINIETTLHIFLDFPFENIKIDQNMEVTLIKM